MALSSRRLKMRRAPLLTNLQVRGRASRILPTPHSRPRLRPIPKAKISSRLLQAGARQLRCKRASSGPLNRSMMYPMLSASSSQEGACRFDVDRQIPARNARLEPWSAHQKIPNKSMVLGPPLRTVKAELTTTVPPPDRSIAAVMVCGPSAS